MVTILLLIGILLVLLVALYPFIYLTYLTKKSEGIHPGLNREVLQPGFRRYAISVPFGYTGEKPIPLILALHYAGHGIPYYGEMFLLSLVAPAFQELEAIIVSPDCPSADWLQPASEQLIFDLLDSVQDQFNIDPKRILITGYSLGGTGTWYYAGRYPERFSAAIVMAGKPFEEVLEMDWQIPLMVIHGREDKIAPLHNTKKVVLELEKKGVNVDLRILESVTHHETHYFVSVLKNAIPWLLENWESE